jgi:ribonucleoside-diphosphate reductase subunit M1
MVLLLLQNTDRLDSEIIYDRDFDYDYFGFKVRHMHRLLPHASAVAAWAD